MCGRYTLSTPGEQLQQVFGVSEGLELEARFNIAPTQLAPIVRVGSRRGRTMAMLRWGLVPYWAEDLSIGNRMINARAETIDQKPAYRDSFSARRCLVAADGFYEWKATGRHKQPFFFSRADGEPFAIAGIWSRWTRGAEPLESYALITTPANEVVGRVHSRMPAILERDSWDDWLHGGAPESKRQKALLRPADEDLLDVYPVSTYVNNPANDSSRCIEAVEVDGGSGESAPQAPLF